MNTSELEYVDLMENIPIKCRIISVENSSPHWHHEYEILFVLRGRLSIYAENSSWRLGRGDMYLFNTREIHSITQPEKNNLCVLLQINPEIFKDFYETSFRFKLNTKSEGSLSVETADLLRYDIARIGLLLYEKPDGYQFLIKSSLYRFAGSMFNHLHYNLSANDSASPNTAHLEDFDLIKQYIKLHFKEDLHIDQICTDLAMSRAKLYRILKTSGTDSPRVLLNYYRIENAKNMLRNTSATIPYIASESGFESDPSFYRNFREITGMTPSQYRDNPAYNKTIPGIQGYRDFSPSEAAELLKKYCLKEITEPGINI